MAVKIGCDLVDIKKFKKSVKNGGTRFLNKIFSRHELSQNSSTQSLAGIFAAKEAVKKALELKAGNWKKIEIVKKQNGRPEINLSGLNKKIISQDMSISHDGEYAMATAIFLISNDTH